MGNPARTWRDHTMQSREAAAREFVQIIVDAVNDAGPSGIPSGLMYTAVMPVITLDTYNYIINALVRHGKIRQSHYVLYPAKI
jgi:hypothetical protein